MSHTGLEDPRVALDRLSERHTASICTTTRLPRLRHTIDTLHELVMHVVGEQGLAPAGPMFTRFHEIGASIAIEAGMPLAQPIIPSGVVIASSLPGGTVMCCEYIGDLEELAAIRETLARLRRIHGLNPAGAPWESYLVDRRDVINDDDRVTEVCLPVSATVPRRRELANGPRRPGQVALSVRQAVC